MKPSSWYQSASVVFDEVTSLAFGRVFIVTQQSSISLLITQRLVVDPSMTNSSWSQPGAPNKRSSHRLASVGRLVGWLDCGPVGQWMTLDDTEWPWVGRICKSKNSTDLCAQRAREKLGKPDLW